MQDVNQHDVEGGKERTRVWVKNYLSQVEVFSFFTLKRRRRPTSKIILFSRGFFFIIFTSSRSFCSLSLKTRSKVLLFFKIKFASSSSSSFFFARNSFYSNNHRFVSFRSTHLHFHGLTTMFSTLRVFEELFQKPIILCEAEVVVKH